MMTRCNNGGMRTTTRCGSGGIKTTTRWWKNEYNDVTKEMHDLILWFFDVVFRYVDLWYWM